MKKMMTLLEFEEYCSQRRGMQISFCTENQSDFMVSDPCKFNLTFDKIRVVKYFNMIVLGEGKNRIKIAFVRSIEVNTELTVFGTVAIVHCEVAEADKVEKTFTLVMF